MVSCQKKGRLVSSRASGTLRHIEASRSFHEQGEQAACEMSVQWRLQQGSLDIICDDLIVRLGEKLGRMYFVLLARLLSFWQV